MEVGLNSLWISYAFLSRKETSWTERIYMKDIVRALGTEDQILHYRCERADSNRFTVAEAKASAMTSKEGLTVYLEYAPTKKGKRGKNGMDPGMLTIHWKSEMRAFLEEPDTVAFTPAKTDVPEFPLFRFLPHRDNSAKLTPKAVAGVPAFRAMSQKMHILLDKIVRALDERKAQKSCITYSQLAEDLGGYAPDSKYIAICLGMLQEEDTRSGEPLRSALVVRKDTGRPGDGFFECAAELGHVYKDREKFWREQVKQLVGDAITIPI